MPTYVKPKVFFIGHTVGANLSSPGLREYLEYTDNMEFAHDVEMAKIEGLSDAEILSSFGAKLCYKSLTPGKNPNIKEVRDIPSNLAGCFNQGHGSVFEHGMLNFVIVDCSRVFTHELVRHRVGTAFSQNSGRYIRLEEIEFVQDPIFGEELPVLEYEEFTVETNALLEHIESYYARQVKRLKLDEKPMKRKKQLTSALRRIAPTGQGNEIMFSCNIRALRHLVEVRTSRFAEWEIRFIFNQIYQIVKQDYPLVFFGAYEEEVDGMLEVKGMKHQPYQVTPLQAIKEADDKALLAELQGRYPEYGKNIAALVDLLEAKPTEEDCGIIGRQ